MGNAAPSAVTNAVDRLKLESVNGKRLLAAIRSNSPAAVLDAIQLARKEYTKPISKTTANSSAYDDMLSHLLTYLKKSYDVGEGPLFVKTPLEYCQELRADKAAAAIKEEIEKLEKPMAARERSDVIKTTVIGQINSDRAIEAKARLQAYREQGKGQKQQGKK